jgi:hypothetical protein
MGKSGQAEGTAGRLAHTHDANGDHDPEARAGVGTRDPHAESAPGPSGASRYPVNWP